MSMIPKCVVCDHPVANPYAPEARCDRCKQDCPTCGGDTAYCQHALPEQALANMVERELRATVEMQRRRDAA